VQLFEKWAHFSASQRLGPTIGELSGGRKLAYGAQSQAVDNFRLDNGEGAGITILVIMVIIIIIVIMVIIMVIIIASLLFCIWPRGVERRARRRGRLIEEGYHPSLGFLRAAETRSLQLGHRKPAGMPKGSGRRTEARCCFWGPAFALRSQRYTVLSDFWPPLAQSPPTFGPKAEDREPPAEETRLLGEPTRPQWAAPFRRRRAPSTWAPICRPRLLAGPNQWAVWRRACSRPSASERVRVAS